MTTRNVAEQTLTFSDAEPSSDYAKSLSEKLDWLSDHPPFVITLPDNESHKFGTGDALLQVHIRNERGLAAAASFDELRYAEAYLKGDIDINGSMYDMLYLRSMMTDRRPLIRLKSLVYRYILDLPIFRKKSIGFHYDEDTRLFFAFLDETHRCYSHGFFESDDESLEVAMERKLDYAIAATGLKSGMRVLDIGGGWGSFLRHAGSRGIEVTAVTISEGQRQFMERVIEQENLPCRVLFQDIYDYEVADDDRFDAIVNLGVTEHLSNYKRLVSQYRKLLRPGGKVYFDSCASRIKYDVGSYINKHIFPGTTSYLCLDEYLSELAHTDLQLELVENDRNNYSLTTKKWGENLEKNRRQVVDTVGEETYRRFRLLIWACAAMFDLDEITAYHVVLRG